MCVSIHQLNIQSAAEVLRATGLNIYLHSLLQLASVCHSPRSSGKLTEVLRMHCEEFSGHLWSCSTRIRRDFLPFRLSGSHLSCAIPQKVRLCISGSIWLTDPPIKALICWALLWPFYTQVCLCPVTHSRLCFWKTQRCQQADQCNTNMFPNLVRCLVVYIGSILNRSTWVTDLTYSTQAAPHNLIDLVISIYLA